MLNNKLKLKIITGIDDATKCPCIGSIFVSGVAADLKTIKKWKKLGVKDSKLIAPKKRFKLAEIIKETAIAYSINQITPQMIDDKTVFNLNDWEMFVVFKIILQLQKTTELNEVYIDNWETSEKLFYKRFEKLFQFFGKKDLCTDLELEKISLLKFIPEHKADENHVIVGAASILSKTSSDDQYKQYKEEFGDFGSGSPADPKTRLYVWRHRKNPPPIIRTSWNTYKMLVNLSSIEDDFLYSRKKRDSNLL